MYRNFFIGVNGALSRGSSVRRPGSKDPHQLQRKFKYKLIHLSTFFQFKDSYEAKQFLVYMNKNRSPQTTHKLA
jgi:hypothetical protein